MLQKHLPVLTGMLFALLFAACEKEPAPVQTEDSRYDHLLMGNPSEARDDEAMEENYLIELPQYVMSYSRSKGTPNWVSWYLNEQWIGEAPRQDDFRAYENLPEGWYQVDYYDYNFSLTGFNRGHNCPSADRTVTQSDNSATFYMINMIPQAPEHNSGIWADMESYSRELAYRGNEVYTIMGVHGKGGTGDEGYREKIAGGRVTVPRYVWKVLVVLPEGVNDVERVEEETRIIAVWTENKNTASSRPWYDYRVSIDDIEAETGFDLLSALPESIQEIVEAKVDKVRVN